MKILESLAEFKDPCEPLVLTIGNFDGMHRGHCALVKKMLDLKGDDGQAVVITFRNHPSEILRPDQPVCLLCTFPHKLLLLQKCLVDQVIILKFTNYLAQHSAASFIETVKRSIPFTHLVLGHDATLGRDKQGDRASMLELADRWGFTVCYLEEFRYEGKAVSSSRIREALQRGDLLEVEVLLNRPYSLYAPVLPKEEQLNSPETIHLDVTGLCLPPPGTYAIETCINTMRKEGLAILKATSRTDRKERAILEIQLEDNSHIVNLLSLEVFFNSIQC